MISKNRIKYIRSLEQRKVRRADDVFLAEGPKLVGELLPYFSCRFLAATADWLHAHRAVKADEVAEASPDELSRASLLRTPQDVIAVFSQRHDAVPAGVLDNQLCLALDGVQDPGNVGTILRIADWFGIEHVFCSADTADVYSPKTVQATMGALARVHVHSTDLAALIASASAGTAVYGTFLDGADIYTQPLSRTGLIIMGNEGNGISREVGCLVRQRLLIPNFPAGRHTTESLNVGVATAVVCAEFRRRFL